MFSRKAGRIVPGGYAFAMRHVAEYCTVGTACRRPPAPVAELSSKQIGRIPLSCQTTNYFHIGCPFSKCDHAPVDVDWWFRKYVDVVNGSQWANLLICRSVPCTVHLCDQQPLRRISRWSYEHYVSHSRRVLHNTYYTTVNRASLQTKVAHFDFSVLFCISYCWYSAFSRIKCISTLLQPSNCLKNVACKLKTYTEIVIALNFWWRK